jgi:integrase
VARDASPRTHLDTYAKRWNARQRRIGKRNADREYSSYQRHVSPLIGSLPVGEIKPLDVLELSETLIARGEISPKSVRNCIGVVSSIFRLAVLEGAVEINPVSQTPRDGLPSMGSSGGQTYTRDEALALLMDPRIGWDRRVVYALQLFTGMRIGEACGRRWRDWVPDARPLGSLRVHSQYDDQPLKTAKSGDSKERMVPVHPELEKVLWCWQGEGFEAVYGRPPGPDDFIVPDPRTMGARTQSQVTKAHKRDAELIGVPNKGSHALRRFMISAARSSGARSDVLEQITHNARGAIIDVYTAWEWPALCEAVSCLKVDPDRLPGRIYDISYDISVFENANPPQSLRLISGGGGNRKPRISSRIRQLRGITGNRISSRRNQNTRKSSFGKPVCQMAKSKPRQLREGRTWERRPPPRPSAAWPARFCRARGIPSRVSSRVSSWSSSPIGGAPSDDRTKRPSRGEEAEIPHRVLSRQ